MVNCCASTGCTNTNLSGRRVFSFPNSKRNGPGSNHAGEEARPYIGNEKHIAQQKDHLSFTCMCIIYSLLFHKTSFSLHTSLVETAGSNCCTVRWHRGVWQLIWEPIILNTDAKALEAHVSWKCSLCFLPNFSMYADSATISALPC